MEYIFALERRKYEDTETEETEFMKMWSQCFQIVALLLDPICDIICKKVSTVCLLVIQDVFLCVVVISSLFLFNFSVTV